MFKCVLCLQIVLCHCCALSLSVLLAAQLIFCPIYKTAISFSNQCVNQASSETSVASSFEEMIVIIWFWVWEETTRENVSWIILTARQKPENFNYCWGLVQNLPTGVAYQAFLPDLGQASQDRRTKVDQEMFPKYWSNPCPETLPERSIWQAEQSSPPFPRRLWDGHWQWGIVTGKC